MNISHSIVEGCNGRKVSETFTFDTFVSCFLYLFWIIVPLNGREQRANENSEESVYERKARLFDV